MGQEEEVNVIPQTWASDRQCRQIYSVRAQHLLVAGKASSDRLLWLLKQQRVSRD